MNINEYQQLAMKTTNTDLSPQQQLIIASMGLCGESGELIDHIKKHIGHNHPLDKEYLVKEMGDIAWYLALMAETLDVSLETVLRKNIEKLEARYPNGFSTTASLERKD